MAGSATGAQRPQLLCIDDEEINRLLLDDLLSPHYRVHSLGSGEEGLAYLAANRVDLVLLDIVMPGMDGFETCRRIKTNPRTRDIPVLFISSLDGSEDEARALSLGAEDFIHKPFSATVALARIRNHLELAEARHRLLNRNQELEHLVAERTRDLLAEKQQVIFSQSATITALCTLAEMRDNETGNHIRRTQHYVRLLAEFLADQPRFAGHLDEETIQQLFKSAPLHDVGKVAIPDAILLKPDRLDADEWAVMKRHTEFGANAIRQAEQEIGGKAGFLAYAREIALSHHEKWDGSGYPQGLKEEEIPLSARLMALADVYDALISARVYKPAFTHERAIEIIREGRGSHFDPDITDAALQLADEFHLVAERFRDSEASRET